MSTREPNSIPADVMEALETLERAQSAANLGRPYQTLLDWRRQHPVKFVESSAMFAVVILGGLAAAYLVTRFVSIPNTDYWRGVQFGLMLAVIINAVLNGIWPRRTPPQTIERRVDNAIGRWRHMVPAMRELPK
jgi:hypothetical protein